MAVKKNGSAGSKAEETPVAAHLPFVQYGKAMMKGNSGSGGNGEWEFVQLDDGESLIFSPITNFDDDAVIWYWQHFIKEGGKNVSMPCIKRGGETCVGCQLENKASGRGLMPILTKEGDKRILGFGVTLKETLADNDDAVEGFKGKNFRIKRTGKALNTTYTLAALGSTNPDAEKVEKPNMIAFLGPTTRAAQIERLQNAGLDVSAMGLVSGAETAVEETPDEDEEIPF